MGGRGARARNLEGVAEVDETRAGLGYGFSAYFLWGAFPLFFPLLEPAGWWRSWPQRMAWSLVVVAILLAVTRGFAGVRAVLRDRRRFGLLAIAAVLISVNWGVYIWGVNAGHVVECSLGYFINPLFTILLGVVVLGERLRVAQWVAVGIGAAAVVVITVDYGRPPWIALTLAASFGLYGFLKKRAGVGAADSLAVETGMLFVPAVVVLIVIAAQGNLAFGHHGVGNTLLHRLERARHRRPAADVRRRHPAAAAVGDRAAAVPDAGAAVHRRRGDPARARAVRRVHRVLPGLVRPDRADVRRAAPPARQRERPAPREGRSGRGVSRPNRYAPAVDSMITLGYCSLT